MRRDVTALFEGAKTIYRAHVWTDAGYSTKTFPTYEAASLYLPRTEQKRISDNTPNQSDNTGK